MSKKDSKKKEEHLAQDVEGAVLGAEQFLERNWQKLAIGLVALIVIFFAYVAYQKFINEPKEIDAKNAMAKAEFYFAKDSMNLALNGDGINSGFAYVADEWGGTPAGNLSKYYAGVCELKLGNFDNALDYLKGFSTDDFFLSVEKNGLIGDVYSEMGKTDEAISAYKKAYSAEKNTLSALYMKKAALLHEDKGEYDVALGLYRRIKDEYYTTSIAGDIDKYIMRAEYMK
ncbi:MAG: tetratricopeptide repeat protein [Bacteroidales bacterium]